jgi:hypothetical protein
VDRDTERDMKKKITVLTLCAILFALCSSAGAQQPKKVPLVGYFSSTDPATEAPVPRQFGWRCASVAISKDKTSPSSTDMRRGIEFGSLS